MDNAEILSVGICLPKGIRDNHYYLNHTSPEVRRHLDIGIGRLWKKRSEDELNAFEIEMRPYLDDPFRGVKERRIMRRDQTNLTFEIESAKNALRAAKMSPSDLDAIIVTSFIPDHPGAGNAAYLAKELGSRCPAWNLESACSSGIVALEVANALIRSGRYRTILLVQSCNYAQSVLDEDPTSWFVGDGAGALILSEAIADFGFSSFYIEPTTQTCGVVSYRVNPNQSTEAPCFLLENVRGAGKILQEVSEPHLLSCCTKAATQSNMTPKEMDFFIFSTPTAWYSAFGARVLDVPKERTISTHEKYGNIGPAMLPVTLYEALKQRKIKSGDYVMLYQIGSVSNAAAAVMRCGDIAIADSEC